jgi:hypothetical protein
MGIIELFVLIFVCVVIGAVAVYGIKTFAPSTPAIIVNGIWFVVIIVVLALLAQAFGFSHFDPQVPRIR